MVWVAVLKELKDPSKFLEVVWAVHVVVVSVGAIVMLELNGPGDGVELFAVSLDAEGRG